MLDSPTWSKVYAPHGYLAVEGDLINRASYGKTLELIAKHGADEFYEGKTASKMVDHIKSQNGVLTLEDVSRTFETQLTTSVQAVQSHTISRHPLDLPRKDSLQHFSTIFVSLTWRRQLTILSGLVAMSILNILEGYDMSAHGCMDDPLNNHRLIEAMKFGFGARSEITDPRFVNATIHQRFEEIYSKDWAKGIRKRIDDVSEPTGIVAHVRTQPMILDTTA
jgi:gamma-glutamyltranspeptidase/glutathione hydrolase/leukotriene-C4 hydrolase